MIDYREEVTMARQTQPGKRTKISVLDVVIVIGGIVGIMAFNRMSIARLQRSLPNATNLIVGEWISNRGPEHLVFRADKTVSMTVAANPAEANASAAPESGLEAPAAPETPAPVTGKYQLAQGGKVILHLMNGKNYTTTLGQAGPKSPGNPNRFDLIDSATGGVTTFERVLAAPASTGAAPASTGTAPASTGTAPASTGTAPSSTGTTPQEPSQ
jgi:hypothetical protein